MAAARDILEDDLGDLKINTETGDLDEGLSDEQHIFDIFDSAPGHWKEFPAIGIEIKKYQGSSGKQQEISRNAKLQLQGDGYTVNNPTVTIDSDGTMIIDPQAERK